MSVARKLAAIATCMAALSGCGGITHAVPSAPAGFAQSAAKTALPIPPPPPSFVAPRRSAVLGTTPAAPDTSGRRSTRAANNVAFFAGETAVSNGVYYLQLPNGNVFGYYSYLPDTHYIYHFDAGYLYVADANDGHGGVYLYDFTSSHWWYTGLQYAFPYLYDFSLNAALYYYPDTNNAGHSTTHPRYFYNFATAKIVTVPAGPFMTPSKLTFAGGSTSPQGVGIYAPGNLYNAEPGTADTSQCAGIATASPAASYSGYSVNVTAIGPGSCTAFIIDPNGVRTALPVLVSTPPTFTIAEFAHTGGDFQHLVRDPAGNLWAALGFTDKIVRRTPGGTETVFPLPANTHPECITYGSDGNLWFAEWGAKKVGRMTPTGTMTHFPMPAASASAQPSCIVQGPDGAFWFTEANHAAIGRITIDGTVSEYPLAASVTLEISGIIVGPDGNMWFTDYQGNKIGRITTAGVVTEFAVPSSRGGPGDLTSGPDGAIWFTETESGLIGRITTAGTTTEYARPSTMYDQPVHIVAGPDGNLWFTEFQGNRVARITPSGIVDEFPAPFNSHPDAIAVGSDGALWFTEANTAKIGRIQP